MKSTTYVSQNPRPGFRECLDPFCHAYDAWGTHYHEDVSNVTTGEREYTREEMREACRNNYNAALEVAASVCANAAVKLLSNGKARVNQVDRHTAEVLRLMEKRILALGAASDVAHT